MGHRHSRDEILAGALQVAVDDSLSQLTFGRVAKHLGISDRVVVYYFPTKDDLVGEVVAVMGSGLQAALAEVLQAPVENHVELLRTAWPVLTDPANDAVFRLFFEANGLAVTGREPYDVLVPALVEAWIEWVSAFIEGPPQVRRREAETAIALTDGLLLVRQLVGVDAAAGAARTLGIT